MSPLLDSSRRGADACGGALCLQQLIKLDVVPWSALSAMNAVRINFSSHPEPACVPTTQVSEIYIQIPKMHSVIYLPSIF